MTTKIKVKYFNDVCKLQNISKGDWIDLKSRVDLSTTSPKQVRGGVITFNNGLIPLGVAIELPKGFEAIIAPRSSTLRNYGMICANSIGIIDNSYKGDNDEWSFSYISMQDSTVKVGDRICQFRIQLNQKASFIQKLKWLLSSKIEFVEVKHLGNTDRKGFGSTGKA